MCSPRLKILNLWLQNFNSLIFIINYIFIHLNFTLIMCSLWKIEKIYTMLLKQFKIIEMAKTNAHTML